MERIKLPLSLGLEVAKILAKEGIKPHSNRQGMLTLEFTKEELEMIEELEIINPSRNILNGISNLPNLKKIVINTLINTGYRQNKSIASISSLDMKEIEKLTSLEQLELINQNGIHTIDISLLKNLKVLKIYENDNLEEINGLDKLKELQELSIYENKNLFSISLLNEVIKNNPLSKLELSLLYFSDALLYNKIDLSMDMESLAKMHSLGDKAIFIEVPTDLNKIIISPSEALKFHQMAINIIDTKLKNQSDTIGYIIGVEEYLTRSINYDYEAISHNFTHSSEVDEIGPKYGSNGAYNTIMFKSCTGEGYSRAMVYLLKLLDIKSHIVSCLKTNDDSLQFTLPDDGFHTVVSINDYYNLYCDPFWDSSYYNNGNDKYNFLPFTLLSKEEISKTHSLMYDEKSTGNETLTVPRKIISTYLTQSKDFVKKVGEA